MTEMGILIHGHSSSRNGKRSKTYLSWQALLARCTNRNAKNFPRYGGVGIQVCDEWRTSFPNFLRDMGERPEGTTLDRIDGALGYFQGNCRWATVQEQAENKRNLKMNREKAEEVRALRGKFTQVQLCAMFGISRSTVCNIFNGRIWS